MGNYDLRVSNAKWAMGKEMIAFIMANPGVDSSRLSASLDELNQAWDALTDCLARQRDERDGQIRRLINELAEAKHKTGG